LHPNRKDFYYVKLGIYKIPTRFSNDRHSTNWRKYLKHPNRDRARLRKIRKTPNIDGNRSQNQFKRTS
ncbi:hypothetical protein N8642_00675, partial [bacterium]|nr:hypothetical protein [bacterium]